MVSMIDVTAIACYIFLKAKRNVALSSAVSDLLSSNSRRRYSFNCKYKECIPALYHEGDMLH